MGNLQQNDLQISDRLPVTNRQRYYRDLIIQHLISVLYSWLNCRISLCCISAWAKVRCAGAHSHCGALSRCAQSFSRRAYTVTLQLMLDYAVYASVTGT